MPSARRRLHWTPLALSVIVATLFCYATYRGPFRWLAELQIAWNGQYDVTVTAVATACVWFVVLRLLSRLILLRSRSWGARKRVMHDTRSIDSSHPASSVAAAASATPEAADGEFQVADVPRRTRPYRYLLLVTLLCWALSGTSAIQFWLTGSLSHLSVADLEEGISPSSGYVQLTEGILLTEASVQVIREGTVRREQFFTPCVSAAWEPHNPVTAFVLTDVPPTSADATAAVLSDNFPWKGLRHRSGMPGAVVSAFEGSAYMPADDYLLLDTTRRPDQFQRRSLMFFKAAVAGTVLWIVLWLRQRRQTLTRLSDQQTA